MNERYRASTRDTLQHTGGQRRQLVLMHSNKETQYATCVRAKLETRRPET
uniref:Uncharacterized protein n=1 Tax=Hyaloperonospora arabidopsidis (strain Emoy2) TaxID=559515 RepID=M4BRY1_HYAAE